MSHNSDAIHISVKLPRGEDAFAYIDRYPDTCPVCRNGIQAIKVYALLHGLTQYNEKLQVVFLCPRNECGALFNGYYKENSYTGDLTLSGSLLLSSAKPVVFSETINKISERFGRIYNQSKVAEDNELIEICGPGYGKALEFLIKDYLIKKAAGNEKTISEIKSARLADAIKKIEDPRIQGLAKKATWVRNDETHYEKRLEDKDLEDLKALIQLVTDWIDLDEVSAKYLDEDKPTEANNQKTESAIVE